MKPNLSLPLFILFCLILSSCLGVFKSIIKEDGKQIPIGFGKENVTILAIKHKRNYNKYLEKNFTSSYSGKYIFVTEEEAKTNYPDVNEYRYTFDEQMNYNTSFNAQGKPLTLAAGTFILHDRKTGQQYSLKLESGLWSKLMRMYLEKLEETRQKNSR